MFQAKQQAARDAVYDYTREVERKINDDVICVICAKDATDDETCFVCDGCGRYVCRDCAGDDVSEDEDEAFYCGLYTCPGPAPKAPETGVDAVRFYANQMGVELESDGTLASFASSAGRAVLAARGKLEGDVFKPADAEPAAMRGGEVPDLFAPFKFSEELAAELNSKETDVAKLMSLMDAELAWLNVPEAFDPNIALHVECVKKRFLTWNKAGRRLGERCRGVSHWRVLDLAKKSLASWLKDELKEHDDWCKEQAEKMRPKPESCECCALVNKVAGKCKAEQDATEEKKAARFAEKDAKRGRSSSMEPDSASVVAAVGEKLAQLLPTGVGDADGGDGGDGAARRDGAASRGLVPGEGDLVPDHVKYWIFLRFWACPYCNTHITWLFDTFENPEEVFKRLVVAAYLSLSNFTSVRARGPAG